MTFRGRTADDYQYTRSDDEHDRGYAASDIVATMDEDDRVRRVTTQHDNVYALLNCGRYDFEFGRDLLESYREMVEDAVILGSNDTTDTGLAKYYPTPTSGPFDSYEEYENGPMGQFALRVMSARHGILARDPFHNNRLGSMDDYHRRNGVDRLE